MPKLDLLCCVVNDGDAAKTLHIARKYGVKRGTVNVGRGTVKSHLLEVLGISERKKEIVTLLVKRESSSDTIRGISEEMAFHKDHHGIAFLYHITDFIDLRNEYGGEEPNDSENVSEVEKSMYNVIYTIVEKGMAEDVIDAATEAGSRGGTIINGRGAGASEVKKVFAVDIEPEKEVVLILTKSEQKDAIVESIKNHLQLDESGQGVIFVLDIAEVYGLKHD